MAKKIFIIHGWDGSSQGDWIPWATEKFKELEYSVTTPDIPNPEKPEIQEWVGYLKSIAISLNQNTYFIGHSIGCQTIMRFIETQDTKVGGAIFVAGWFDLINLENAESEAVAKPWIETPMNYEKIKNNLTRSILILGDNDPWVPYEKTKHDFETKIGSEVITLHNAGHITSDDGFGPFPQLIEIFEKNFK